MNQPCFICGRETTVPFEAEKQNPEAGKHALCNWCKDEKDFLDDIAIDEFINHVAKNAALTIDKFIMGE